MKKTLVVIILIIVCTVFAGCGHEHNMAEEVTVEATCETDGQIKKYCKECGDYYIEKIESKGHDYGEYSVVKNATCTTDGVEECVCKVCGNKETSVISADHTLEEKIVNEATCDNEGLKEIKCKKCEYETTETIKVNHLFIGDECQKCDAIKATSMIANKWYIYKDLSSLQFQNCLISNAVATGKGVMVMYYPVCEFCKIVGMVGLAGPEVGYPIAKYHHCDECGESTMVKLQIVY